MRPVRTRSGRSAELTSTVWPTLARAAVAWSRKKSTRIRLRSATVNRGWADRVAVAFWMKAPGSTRRAVTTPEKGASTCS